MLEAEHFLSVLLMQSIFGKHQKPFGLNNKSNREGFDTSPCLPVARKVCEPIPFSDAVMFFSKCQRSILISCFAFTKREALSLRRRAMRAKSEGTHVLVWVLVSLLFYVNCTCSVLFNWGYFIICNTLTILAQGGIHYI